MVGVSFFTTCLPAYLYFRTMLHIPSPSSPSCWSVAWPGLSGWLAGWLSIFCQSSASPLFGSSSARPPSLSELRAAAFLTPLHQSLPTGPTAYRRTPPPPPPPGPHTFPNTRGRSDQIRARASCCVKSSPSAFGVSQSVVALTPLDQ
jgi:hypothetical protein